MPTPNITRGQIAIDPLNGLLYYRNSNGTLLSATLNWRQVQGSSSINTNNSVTIDQNLIVTGNLTVNGTTVTLNTETVNIEDNILILNSNFTGEPTLNAGIEVERGSQTNVSIRWNEDINKWQVTNNGTDYFDLASGNQVLSTTSDVQFNSVTSTFIGNITGNVTGNLTGSITGTVSDISNHGINALGDVNATPNSGDFLKWNGSYWVNDLIDLSTDTNGDYVGKLQAGTGITISNNFGESSTPLISIGQDVATSATPTFARVIAPITGNVTGNVVGNLNGNVIGNVTGNVTGNLTGDVTGNVNGNVIGNLTGNVSGTVSDISNHGINDLSDVALSSPTNGDFLRYNGSNWINDPVNLTTDTVGDYVAKLAAGSGITITNNSGEGATPNIAFSGTIDSVADVQITAAVNGQTLIYDGTNWVNTTFPSSEPIGHENKADSVISFDEGSRQFSISPASTSYTVWCTGKRYVKTSTETVTIPDTSGLYYIYFNSSGSLAYKTTFFTWDQDTPTAYVYWNQDDDKAYFFADERHGVTLDWATHEYLHRTRGAAIANGFGASNYVLDGDGSLDAHAKIDIAGGTFFDEDLQVDIDHSPTPTPNTWKQRLENGAYIPVFYKLNSSWKKDVATQYPFKKVGTRSTYNLNTSGTWSTQEIDNSKYGVMFIVATNNLNEPILSIMGQSQYTDQGSAEASSWDDLDLTGFPIVEFRPLYKIVFQTATSYANTAKTKFVNLLDLRRIITPGEGIPSSPVSDHGNMTGLSDDDHTQYLNTARHDAHDHSTALSTASINDLGDVSINTVIEGQGLIWSGSSWVNSPIPLNLDGLSDVAISTATPNQVLKFDGINWVNSALPPAPSTSTYTATIGDGSSSSITITHNLGTRDVFVTARSATSPYESYYLDWEATSVNAVTLLFASPPPNNSLNVKVFF